MRTAILLAGLLVAGAALCPADDNSAIAAVPPCCKGGDCACAQARSSDDFAALERFLVMNDQQLERIQQAIAKVRAMSPAERAALHACMHEFRQLPADEQEQVRAGAGWLNDADRRDWPEMMRSLPDAERAALRVELRALPPGERATRKHTLLENWRQRRSKP